MYYTNFVMLSSRIFCVFFEIFLLLIFVRFFGFTPKIDLNSHGCFLYRHRVDRALGFFSSRPNWDPPTPWLPQASVSPPGSGGRDTLSCERWDWGVPIRMRGQTLWYSRCLPTFVIYIPARDSNMCCVQCAGSVEPDLCGRGLDR